MPQIFRQKRQYTFQSQHFRPPFPRRRPDFIGDRARPIQLCHPAADLRRTAAPVQPHAPRHRRRHRLPVLSYVGRDLVVRGNSADQNVHELPLGSVRQRGVSGAGAGKFPRQQAAALGARPRPARFRLFQSQHPHQEGRWVRDMSWARRPDAPDVSAELAPDGVVHRLSQEPRAEPPPAQRGHDDGIPAGHGLSRFSARN